MSAVAALAVASPFAVVAVSGLSAGVQPAAEHHEFVPAASIMDLPTELMAAISQGLSQFGVNVPPLPTGLSPAGAMPATSPGLTSPGLTSPGLTAPGLMTPGLTTPGITDPALTDPALTSPTGLTPGLTSPTGLTPGLTSPLTGADPALTSPTGTTPGLLPADPNEVPIAAPVGLDPGMDGTYPILGDPSLGAMPATTSTGGGGIVNEVMSAAQQLGVGQVIDLIKGVVMPSITQAAQGAAPAAAPAVPVPGIPAPLT